MKRDHYGNAADSRLVCDEDYQDGLIAASDFFINRGG
jgi:hypothetical protein